MFTVMFLGLALLSFGPEGPGIPTGHIGVTPPDSTGNPKPTITPFLTPTLTPTPSPSPTPTPSLAELNAEIPIQAAEDETGLSITEWMTKYLNAYHGGKQEELSALLLPEDVPSAEVLTEHAETISQIANISCYYKEGLSYADYIVYVCYDIKYAGSNVFIPTLEEYAVSLDAENGTCTVYPEAKDEDMSEALFLSRASQSVQELYIMETIRRYMNAKLACDEEVLNDIVTDPSYINITDIEKKTQYIERHENFHFLLRPVPETVSEFRYVAYVEHDVKLINIATAAPGADEFLIAIDENNYPKIFFGATSEAANAFLIASHEQDDFIQLRENVQERLTQAMLADPNLFEFLNRIQNSTEEEETE